MTSPFQSPLPPLPLTPLSFVHPAPSQLPTPLSSSPPSSSSPSLTLVICESHTLLHPPPPHIPLLFPLPPHHPIVICESHALSPPPPPHSTLLFPLLPFTPSSSVNATPYHLPLHPTPPSPLRLHTILMCETPLPTPPNSSSVRHL